MNYCKGNLIQQVKKGHIIHGCNAYGVMGAGFAKQVKDTYPRAYQDYRNAYNFGGLPLGSVVTTIINHDLVIHSTVIQREYGRTGGRYINYEALYTCLETVNNRIDLIEHKELHFPKIGCGLAGGKWEIVGTMIETVIKCEKFFWEL